MSFNWKKPLLSLAACVLLLGASLGAILFRFSAEGPSRRPALVLDNDFYQHLVTDQAALPVLASAAFLAKEDSAASLGLENEFTARCLLQVDQPTFSAALRAISRDTAFAASTPQALTASTDIPPTQVVQTAKRLGLRQQEFTRVFTRHSRGRYHLTLGFHQGGRIIFLNYLTY